MRHLSFLLFSQASLAAARFLHSLPDDTYAFPKFRVAFLNASPVLNDTAQRWLREGLRGGQAEFLDQSPPSLKEISGVDVLQNDDIPSLDPLLVSAPNYALEHMMIGPQNSYICLIPRPPDINPPPPTEDVSDSEISPVRSWSLLHPLTGTCLYHRQGWFTYSYCHNREIRQFKELIQPNPHHIIGGYKPEEDPDWEAYTLGKAPTDPGADLTPAEQNAHIANFELARNAGSRYLVQRWGDGTICDKTGKGREVEVQFHCSMTMTDTILFVKETKTCSYVLVIHTPRLCGEPGFRSRLESSDETQISCREIISTPATESDMTSTTASPTSAANTKVGQASSPLPATDYPLKSARHKAVLPLAPPQKVGVQSKVEGSKDKVYEELIRKTLEAMFGANTKPESGEPHIGEDALGNGDDDSDVVIELLGDPELFDQQSETMGRLVDALRGGGYNVKAEGFKVKVESNDGEDKDGEATARDATSDHDEL